LALTLHSNVSANPICRANKTFGFVSHLSKRQRNPEGFTNG